MSLDDDWLDLKSRDAEDSYFDEAGGGGVGQQTCMHAHPQPPSAASPAAAASGCPGGDGMDADAAAVQAAEACSTGGEELEEWERMAIDYAKEAL